MIPRINSDVLRDAISCVVTEERNSKYELKMEYPSDGHNADKIVKYAEIAAKPNENDDEQLFRIYKITKTLNGKFTANGEHISYRMTDIPVKQTSATASGSASAVSLLMGNVVGSNPFSVSIQNSRQGTFAIPKPRSLRSYLLGEEGSLLQIFNGEWKFDNYSAVLMANRGSNNNVLLEYGKNITGMTYDDDISNVYNGVYPYWTGSVDGVETIVQPSTIVYSSNHASFPYDKIKIVDFSNEFDVAPTDAQLRARAATYITENGIGQPKISVNVNFIPLWQAEGLDTLRELEKVALCDTVIVYVPKYDVNVQAKVVKTVYNVLKERYDSIEIGTVKQDLTSKLSGNVQTLSTAVKQVQSNLGTAVSAIDTIGAIASRLVSSQVSVSLTTQDVYEKVEPNGLTLGKGTWLLVGIIMASTTTTSATLTYRMSSGGNSGFYKFTIKNGADASNKWRYGNVVYPVTLASNTTFYGYLASDVANTACSVCHALYGIRLK